MQNRTVVMAPHRPALLALDQRILHTEGDAIAEIRAISALAANDAAPPPPGTRFQRAVGPYGDRHAQRACIPEPGERREPIELNPYDLDLRLYRRLDRAL
jgi:hypothetical protein